MGMNSSINLLVSQPIKYINKCIYDYSIMMHNIQAVL